MNKDIKDYLHLYLGCDVLCGDKIRTLTAIQSIAPFVVTRGKNDARLGDWRDMANIKPILRPLSDMTKEEGYELCQLLQWGVGESTMNEIVKYGVSGVDITVQEQAEFFRILLSKHFNLFGLIESGLAIDKTTLK